MQWFNNCLVLAQAYHNPLFFLFRINISNRNYLLIIIYVIKRYTNAYFIKIIYIYHLKYRCTFWKRKA